MTVRVVNTGKKPFEFMWDGKMFPALKPGDVVEMEEWLASHAIRKSQFLNPDTGKMETCLKIASEVDPKTFRYACPMARMGLCNAESFSTLKDLQDHIAIHEQERAKKSARSEAMKL
jgi:hypothetical protein